MRTGAPRSGRCVALGCELEATDVLSGWCVEHGKKVGATERQPKAVPRGREGGRKPRQITTSMAAWLIEEQSWLYQAAREHAEENGGDYEDGLDLAFDVLIAAWDKPKPKNAQAYLTKSIKNRWLNVIKARKRQAEQIAEAGAVRIVPERDNPNMVTERDLRTVKMKIKTRRGGIMTVNAPWASEVRRLPRAAGE